MEKPGGESRWNTLRALRILRAPEHRIEIRDAALPTNLSHASLPTGGSLRIGV